MNRIHRVYSLIFQIWRAKRYEDFREIMGRGRLYGRVLDVGGYPAFWESYGARVADEIDCLNIHPIECDPEGGLNTIKTCLGDGCAMPEVDSGAYDLVFSNSVIEHVGSWERQEAFAHEVRRVGKSLWVQTPAYECPIEPHYLTPFIHYLSDNWQIKLMRWGTVWGWVAKPDRREIEEAVRTTHLLTRSQMQALFPDCEILVEKLFGIWPKSYIAVRQARFV